MEDIVPELYKRIKDEFYGLVSSDEEIQAILNGENPQATFSDVSILSRRLGEYAAISLEDNYQDSLPDGILYWNIMQRTIAPLMQEVQNIVNLMADYVQGQNDAKFKIGIKPQHAEFPKDRITDLMNKLSTLMEDAEDVEDEYAETF